MHTVKFFTFLMCLQWTSSSLLSRFRYPNEYVVPTEDPELTVQLPDDILGDVNRDLEPDLGPVRKTQLRHQQMPYLRRRTTIEIGSENDYEYRNEGPPLKDEEEEDEIDEKLDESIPRVVYYTYTPTRNLTAEAEWSSTEAQMSTNKLSSRMLPFIGGLNATNETRRIFNKFLNFIGIGRFDGPLRAKCFYCNHMYIYDIPESANCYLAFESTNTRARQWARRFRAECHHNEDYQQWRIKELHRGGKHYKTDRGLKKQYCGKYIGGCFKRFTDVGQVWTTRGCRMHWPYHEHHMMRHRYTRLEVTLFRKKNMCVTSPVATLVPYSRAISMFARHHVCVCERWYCNDASTTTKLPLLIILIIVSLLYI